MKKLFILMTIVLLFAGCKKDDEITASMVELKNETIEKGWDYLKISAEYSYPEALKAVNIYLSENSDMSGAEVYECNLDGKKISLEVKDLKDGVKYYYHYEYDNGYEKKKGEKGEVTTIAKPVVSQVNISELTISSVKLGGNVTSVDDVNKITARGFCWGTSQNPTTEGLHTIEGSGTGDFTSDLTNLSENTTYFVRAYALNAKGTVYGEERSFKTVEIVVPTVTTNDIINITANSAECGGNVTSDGNGTVTARGICWSTSPNPTIADSYTTSGSGIGNFTSQMTGLTDNTTYYVRAYATNEKGTVYGEEKSIITLELLLPTVTTNNISEIRIYSATSGGNVTSDGNGTVTARGVCWSTNQNPTIADSHTTDGSGTGSFTSQMTGLTDNTTYYVRAYATNEKGTSYGEEKNFKTLEIVEPTVTTKNITGITINSATSGGNITSDGNGTVTARGVCWSTNQNPTIADSHTTDGSGTGSFTSQMTGLTDNTTYYVRAYATNEKGTSYGEEKNFKTLEIVEPTVTTKNITGITINSATSGGNVTSDGNGTVTARGVCWSTSPNPTTADSHTTDGSGTGSFTSQMTGLTGNTTYYVRAYATNEKGIVYGEERSFTTVLIITVNGVSFTMIAVEGGTFQMGATSEQGNDAFDDEYPVHSVTLSDYYIGETEVTQELWEAVMGSNPSCFKGDQKPVECVSWNDCQDFIEELNRLTGMNFRLPTEAEWEYAARGGNMSEGYKYSGSNTIGNVAWYTGNSNGQTHNVKSKSPNELGIYDMSGNVFEWCQDWYDSDYYSSSPQDNPQGPSSGSRRVLRGGSWIYGAGGCRVSNRSNDYSGITCTYYGLRLSLS